MKVLDRCGEVRLLEFDQAQQMPRFRSLRVRLHKFSQSPLSLDRVAVLKVLQRGEKRIDRGNHLETFFTSWRALGHQPERASVRFSNASQTGR